jgi:hypothetical protein
MELQLINVLDVILHIYYLTTNVSNHVLRDISPQFLRLDLVFLVIIIASIVLIQLIIAHLVLKDIIYIIHNVFHSVRYSTILILIRIINHVYLVFHLVFNVLQIQLVLLVLKIII